MLTKVNIAAVDVKKYFCHVDYSLHFNIMDIHTTYPAKTEVFGNLIKTVSVLFIRKKWT